MELISDFNSPFYHNISFNGLIKQCWHFTGRSLLFVSVFYLDEQCLKGSKNSAKSPT